MARARVVAVLQVSEPDLRTCRRGYPVCGLSYYFLACGYEERVFVVENCQIIVLFKCG